SVMRLGERPVIPMAIIPTGSIALDVALGVGGLPRGRVVEIYGPESSGKCLTADTYVWTDRGLETVAELFARCEQPVSCTSRITPGDFLVSATFGAVEAAAGDGLSEDEAVLLGYLVAEGSLSYQHSIRFTNWDPEVHGEFCRLMEQLFGVEVRNYDDKDFAVH